jgi:hypothetical protein
MGTIIFSNDPDVVCIFNTLLPYHHTPDPPIPSTAIRRRRAALVDNEQTREEMRSAVSSAALAVTSVVKMKNKAASISCKILLNIFIVMSPC